jgi:hypothetical protein
LDGRLAIGAGWLFTAFGSCGAAEAEPIADGGHPCRASLRSVPENGKNKTNARIEIAFIAK